MERAKPMQNAEVLPDVSQDEPLQPVCSPDSRRERKKQETRQKLLESAWQLCQEKGYERTTVEDITDAADVAKGTFFNYFETREAMLNEMALWRIALLRNRVFNAADLPASAIARIKLLLQAMATEFPTLGGIAWHLPSHRHEGAHRLDGIMQELVQQGQTRGEIRAGVDAWLVARLLMTCFFYHAIHSCPSEDTGRDALRPNKSFTLEAQIAESVDTLLDGLGGSKWRDS